MKESRLLVLLSMLLVMFSISACGGSSSSSGVASATGTLDSAFNAAGSIPGIVTHDAAAGASDWDEGSSVTLASNGKIVVAGFSWNGTNNDMAIWRYNTNGTIDTSFNTVGYVAHDNAAGGTAGHDAGYSVTTDANGKIVVAGFSNNSTNSDMAIWRYNTNGTLDTSFNTVGFAAHDNAAGGSSSDYGYSVTTDANSKIVVTGQSNNGTNYDMVIWRYNTNGTLDTSFNSAGYVVHDNAAGGAAGTDAGESVTIDSNGKIVVTGYSTGTNADMAIWRYNTDGTLDTSFNSTGIVVHSNAAGGTDGGDYGKSVTTDANGRIVVTGFSTNGTDNDMVVWRYNTDGSLDTSFNTVGIVAYDDALGLGSDDDRGRSVTTDANGKIVVAGASYDGSGSIYKVVIWQYNTDGTLDTSFDTDGVVTHAGPEGVAGSDDGFNDLTINSGGNIIATGYTDASAGGSSGNMLLMKYK